MTLPLHIRTENWKRFLARLAPLARRKQSQFAKDSVRPGKRQSQPGRDRNYLESFCSW
jgi:hypothetical protein